MKIGKTQRGFQLVEFTDLYGTECSLQESSLAEKSAIWFGPSKANPQVIVPGKSWQPVLFPEGTSFTTRAHLDIKTVKKLIPMLQSWVETGYFKPPRKRKVS